MTERITDAPVGEYLTFTLGDEEYGIDILKVQEIRGYDAVTTIANSPEFIKGVINLRGTIVPIVDMRINSISAQRDLRRIHGGDHSERMAAHRSASWSMAYPM